MFATLKRAAKALRVPTQAELDLAYLNEAGDRYDLEARERNLSRRAPNRGLGLSGQDGNTPIFRCDVERSRPDRFGRFVVTAAW